MMKTMHIYKPFPIDYQAFPYTVLSFSLEIIKPFPMDYEAFPYRLPSLSLDGSVRIRNKNNRNIYKVF